ncbi:MAG: hypothetical protein Q8O76_13110 [Chloroflexota bacterium]|nr:hypothetical protein [Chloroflexota bacterium]
MMKVLLFLALLSWLLLYSAPGCSPHFTLSVGTTHSIYALPLRLAASADKPIFEENGLTVNIMYFPDRSQMERALLRGEIDAALDDLVGAVMLNKDSEQAKVVLTAMRAYPSGDMWAMVTASRGVDTSPANLYEGKVAIPKGMAARYVGHRLLVANGVDSGRVNWQEVDDGWQALEALEGGRATGALLPEPMLSLAVARGSRLVVGDRESLSDPFVILFSQRVVKEQAAAIIRFTGSYEQAMWELNRNAERYRPLMAELAQSPIEIGGKLPMPLFPFPSEVPTESEVEAIGQWLGEQRWLSPPLPYRHVVDPRFLPPPGKFAPARCCLP